MHVSCQRFDGLEVFAVEETAGMMGPRVRALRDTARELPRGLARMRTLGDYGDSYRGMWTPRGRRGRRHRGGVLAR